VYKMWFEGVCPQCCAEGKIVTLLPNMAAAWECPTCHLQVSTACDWKSAIVMRERGDGDFVQDPEISVSKIPNPKERALREDDGGSPGEFITTEGSFMAYLSNSNRTGVKHNGTGE
jgi:hypothetical protein